MLLQGGMSPDFEYAGYYFHSPSGLNLTLTRVFDSRTGRFINRDPIAEQGGLNLYDYVNNDPIVALDELAWEIEHSVPKAKQDAARLKAELEKRILEQQEGSTDPRVVQQHIKAFTQKQQALQDALRRWRLYCCPDDKPPKDYTDLENAKPPVPNPQQRAKPGTLPMVPMTPLSPAVGPTTIPGGIPTIDGVPIFEIP